MSKAAKIQQRVFGHINTATYGGKTVAVFVLPRYPGREGMDWINNLAWQNKSENSRELSGSEVYTEDASDTEWMCQRIRDLKATTAVLPVECYNDPDEYVGAVAKDGKSEYVSYRSIMTILSKDKASDPTHIVSTKPGSEWVPFVYLRQLHDFCIAN